MLGKTVLALTGSLLAPVQASTQESGPRSANWDLRGRTAVVTGGSKGLGRAIVEELLAQGCEVVTCARDISPLELLDSPRCTAVQAVPRERLPAQVATRRELLTGDRRACPPPARRTRANRTARDVRGLREDGVHAQGGHLCRRLIVDPR